MTSKDKETLAIKIRRNVLIGASEDIWEALTYDKYVVFREVSGIREALSLLETQVLRETVGQLREEALALKIRALKGGTVIDHGE